MYVVHKEFSYTAIATENNGTCKLPVQLIHHDWGELERAPHKRYNIARMVCIYVYMVRWSHSVHVLFSDLAYCKFTLVHITLQLYCKILP